MIYNESVGNQYFPSNVVVGYIQSQIPYYGTLTGADTYFKQRLHTQSWDFAEQDDRVAALTMATRRIEVLAFKGHKAVIGQILFFPRTIDIGDTPQPCPPPPYATWSLTDFTEGWNPYGFPPILPDPVPVGTPKVPGDIEIACYEIALCLLNGIDPDVESRNLSVNSQGYAGARTGYDRTFVQDHIRAGIPSAYAWSILRPYLADPQAVRFTRGA